MKELLQQLRVEYAEAGQHHHARPGWIQLAVCPFCNSAKYHLGYHLSLGYFNCWRCGGHHVVEVLTRLGLRRQEALEFWKRRGAVQIEKPKVRGTLKEPKHRCPLGRAQQDYLRSRGFDPDELVATWHLEGIGLHPRLAWRIYIPIELDGERVSWTTRSILGAARQRYISASSTEESISHKRLVYGRDYCHHSVVVVEGPADAWAIGPGAGALFGTAFSSAQVRSLARIPYRFICFDAEPAGQSAARELIDQLAPFPGETVNLILDAKDPGSASERELKLIRRTAKLI